MTLSPCLIYFADICDTLNKIFVIILFPAIWIALGSFLSFQEEKDGNEKKTLHTVFCFSLGTFIFFLLAFIFTPSTQTVYKMIAVPAIVNSPVVQKLPDELQLFIDKELMLTSEKGEKPSE